MKILFALFVFFVACQCHEGAQFYCGRNLAEALALLCDTGMLVKKAESPLYNALMPRGGEPIGNMFDWPWLAPHRARSLERGKRQVVSECCEKPCTLNELLNYCAN